MQNDSNVEIPQTEIPEYLRCDPRTYKVTYDKFSDTCELEFTLVIKCTDAELHEHNNFWSEHVYRLSENDGDIVAVILKMIARDVFFACYQNKDLVSTNHAASYGINSIFHEEGWNPKCFEITEIYFDNYVDGSLFNFEKVLGN